MVNSGNLLIFVAVVTARFAVSDSAANESSTSVGAEGASGSGVLLYPTPPAKSECSVGVPPGRITEEERAFREAHCFLACTSDNVPENEATRNTSTSPYWPYVVVQRDCTVSQVVHECTRGCLIAFYHSNNLRTCSPKCSSDCRLQECNDSSATSCKNPDAHDPWLYPECSIGCVSSPSRRGNPCIIGCGLLDPVNEGESPIDPAGPPSLIQSSVGAGQYFVELSNTAPDFIDRPNRREYPSVVFLFRLEETTSRNVSFILMADPNLQLNLSDYACQELMISFAVTNKDQLSHYSPPALLVVESEADRMVPHPPTNLRLSEELDERIGLFGHVILNILWDAPPDDPYLDNFTVVVTVSTDTMQMGICGSNSWTDTVSYNITSIIVKDLPVMTCTYDIQVYAEGIGGRSAPLKQTYKIMTTFNKNSITFGCERIWDTESYLFLFNFTWILPSYLRYGNVINGFSIKPRMTDISTRPPTTYDYPSASMIVSISLQEGNSTIVSKILYPNETHRHGGPRGECYHKPRVDILRMYLFETNITWNSDNLIYVPPRFINSSQPFHDFECTESSLSPQPSPVRNVSVLSQTVSSSSITLTLSWLPPSVPNGELAPYNVCIGAEPLEPGQEVQLHTGHFCGTVDVGTQGEITLRFIPEGEHQCLYIQMRAHNLYVAGEWSNASVVSLHESGLCEAPQAQEFPVGMVVGSSLGGLFLLFILLCCCCLITCCVKTLRRRKKLWKITQQEYSIDPVFEFGPRRHTLDKLTSVDASLTSPLQDIWEIPANEIIMEDVLGEGAFGEVYKGIVKCPIINPKVKLSGKNPICTPVAIKLLKLSAKGNERQDFLSEIEMMKKVAEGQNPHVVCLVGCVTIQEPLSLITEFVKYGDLLSYLRTNRRILTGTNSKEDVDAYINLGNVSPVDLVSFAYQIASGMEYLSSLGIVHRDLAARNILVDEGKVLKISDLGMSRETDEIYVQKRTGRVPLKWMAIESIIAREFTSASDVWSYGVILWEIGTLGGFPYPSVQNEDLLSLLNRGYRMEKPDNCSPQVYEIMLMCWNEDPRTRPSFAELRAKFDAMLLADRNDEYIDLRIDNEKLYYMLDTSSTEAAAANSLRTSPVPSILLSQFASKECSPKPLPTPDFSPSRKSSSSSIQCHPSMKTAQLIPSAHLSSSQSSTKFNTAERKGRSRRNQAHENGRPASLLLLSEQEKQDRYVDEPSRMALASLAVPGTNGKCRSRVGSDGAIEMNHLEMERVMRDKPDNNTFAEVEITVHDED